ncbi:MAG: PhoH family protein [Alphaproteobacteria bacterium]|nr:PhoH family protein [Alphaproteobacteria bacterium]
MSQISLQFSENHLISALAIPPYSWLNAIESHLAIKIFQRGNHVILEGEEQSCQLASNYLQQLYDSAKIGEFPSPTDAILPEFFTNDMPAETENKQTKNPYKKTPRQKEAAISIGDKLLTPANQAQSQYLDAISNHLLTFGVGPAGTGKTHLAVGYGIKLLLEQHISHVIFARPAVEAGERLGYLPGDMRDKIDPYFQPIYDSLHDFLGKEQTERYMLSGKIDIAPLAYMRGRTLKNAFILLDEAQNATPKQMKMFLTRLGEHSRMVINGDLSQTDLPDRQLSGLQDAINHLQHVDKIAICHFHTKDIMRHNLVRDILAAYEHHNTKSYRKS